MRAWGVQGPGEAVPVSRLLLFLPGVRTRGIVHQLSSLTMKIVPGAFPPPRYHQLPGTWAQHLGLQRKRSGGGSGAAGDLRSALSRYWWAPVASARHFN